MTQVEILHGYRGNPTNDEYLPRGVHQVDDTLADYLVEHGHARFVADAPRKGRKQTKEVIEHVDSP